MSRLFSDAYTSYKQRLGSKRVFKSKVFIAFEGSKTEPAYFRKVSKLINGLDQYTIEIFPVDRYKGDGKSHPNHVRDGLLEYYEQELGQDFIKKRDALGILIDIDNHFQSAHSSVQMNYTKFLETLKTKDGVLITPYVCNPNFELWLILQLCRAEELDFVKIKKNSKVGKTTYMKTTYQELNTLYSHIPFETRLHHAIEQAASMILQHDIKLLWDEVGTNLHHLFERLFARK